MTHARLAVTLLPILLLACKQTDPDTGEVIPRGGQQYSFEVVKDKADQLFVGMSTEGVRVLLGTPAEKNHSGDIWVYMPDRPAVLIPGKALQLEFWNGSLKRIEWRPVVLGQDM